MVKSSFNLIVMKKEEIKFGDWMRVFMGETPPEFLIEVVIRMFFIYFLLMVSMRLLGRRMSAQLSRNEMLAVVTLAAAIGVPLQSPDRGLLPAFIIALVVVLIGRLISTLAFRSQKIEQVTQGNINVLVQDSTLQLKDMLHSRVTLPRLFSQLRCEGIYHLGEVKRLYMEANGSFTLIKNEQPKPGLSVLPPWDEEFRHQQKEAAGVKVCSKCGNTKRSKNSNERCDKCNNDDWVNAVV